MPFLSVSSDGNAQSDPGNSIFHFKGSATYNTGTVINIRISIFPFVFRQSCNQLPILSVSSDGNVLSGSIAAVVSATKNAEDIRIISNGGYSFPADNIEYDTSESSVGAMGIWHVSRKTVTKGGIRTIAFQVCHIKLTSYIF